MCIQTWPASCPNRLIMAARVRQAACLVSQPLTRRRERPATGETMAVDGTQAVPQQKPIRRSGKKTPKAAPPPATKNCSRIPHSKGDSPSPPLEPPVGTCNYCGPKFCEPPSPSALPKPPVRWMNCGSRQPSRSEVRHETVNQPKLLLKVNA